MRTRAFTLVELLISSAIFAIIIVVFTSVLVSVSRVSVKQNAQAEVNAQSTFLLQSIQKYVERSSNIDQATDTPSYLLKLRMASTSADPTYIYLSGTTVYIQQGTSTPVQLSSNQVKVNSLSFVRHTNLVGHDSVNVQMSISYNSASAVQTAFQSLDTTITRVSAATFDANIIPSANNTYKIGVAAQDWQSINNTLFFGTNGVGVGTGASTPNSQLDVAGAMTFRGMSAPATSTAGQAVLYFDSTQNKLLLSQNAGAFASIGNPWNSSGTAIYYNAGNVGIGTTNPSVPLENKQSLASSSLLRVYNQSSNGYGVDFVVTASGTQDVALLRGNDGNITVLDAKANGNVGIGTSTPSALLHVYGANGSDFLTKIQSTGPYGLYVKTTGTTGSHDLLRMDNNSGPAFDLMADGTANKIGGTAWTALSDIRLKNVLANVVGTALDKILKLRPIKYQWNDRYKKLYGVSDESVMYGFAAQELMQVFPEFVKQRADGYYEYNPSGFEAVLTAAIRELNAKVDALDIQVVDGVAHMAHVVIDFLEVHTMRVDYITADNGVTTRDRTTGAPYCMAIDKGQVLALPGPCQ